MDHPSTHAHQSHSLSPAATDSARQPTYTTVGSVYNPQGGTQLQPPVRRARPVRFPQQPDPGSAPKPAVPGLPLKGLQSPPQAKPAVPQYSPLQQNLQRAVDPTGIKDPEAAPRPAMAARRPKGHVVKPALPLSPMRAVRKEPLTTIAEELSPFAVENGADHPDVGILTTFNARSLNNLSSYPHKFQRHAQAALARGRPPLAATTNFQPVSVTLGGTSTATPGFSSRVSTPPGFKTKASTPPGFPSRISTPPGFPSRKPDLDPSFWEAVINDPTILNGADFSSQAKARAEILRQNGKVSPPYPLVDTHKAVQQPLKPREQGYTTLSSGPGAPAPLQAGPPGQRHYKPSSLEGTFKALQDSAHRAVPASEVKQARTADSDSVSAQSKRASRPATRLGSPPTAQPTTGPRANAVPILPPVAPPNGEAGALVIPTEAFEYERWLRQPYDLVVDTLSPEQAMKYYPKGFPANYNPATVMPISPNWTDWYPLHGQLKPRLAPDAKEMHNAKLAATFYAGTAGLGRTMDDSILDAERRVYGTQYGAIGQERALNHELQKAAAADLPMETKAEYRHLSVEQVNSEETADSAGPLLNMTFEMLLSYMEDEGKKCDQSGFDDPEPWLIDFGEDGPKSFFSNGKKKIDQAQAAPRA